MEAKNIDKNFDVEPFTDLPDTVFYDAEQPPFVINGVFREGDSFCRMPKSVAKTVNDGVDYANMCAAGGRVRFRCDSPYITVTVWLKYRYKMSHFAITGSVGCDLFRRKNGREEYVSTIVPPFDVENKYRGCFKDLDRQMTDYTVNLPTYSSISKIVIGVKEGTEFETPREYSVKKPVVFYGSSITHGACSSRPGAAYEAILSRMLDFDFVNLGFSGNALGEESMARHIASLDMSAFVYDYDHNAPSVDHLKNTHKPMFDIIRKAHPDLPIIMLPRPKFYLTDEEKQRAEVIKSTYNAAVLSGDKNVYYIDNRELIPEEVADVALVDNCHPTDAGFLYMAKAIYPVLKAALEKK